MIKSEQTAASKQQGLEGTLMQILKIFLYVYAHIKMFAFLILKTLELFAREVCKFLKKANF